MDTNASTLTRFPNLPERIRGLEQLVYNLWWSWNRASREMFRALDLQAWLNSAHNPLRMLTMVSQENLEKAARNPEFLERYDAVMAYFEAEVASHAGWYTAEYGRPPAPIAYFSAEYAFHNSLPLYAGGSRRSCRRLHQRMQRSGGARRRGRAYLFARLRFAETTRRRVARGPGKRSRSHLRSGPARARQTTEPSSRCRCRCSIRRFMCWCGARISAGFRSTCSIRISKRISLGTAPSAIACTSPESEQRLRQEIVLGVGGMCVLEALGIQPAGIHINEGHPGLALLEHVRMLVQKGASFQEAVAKVRETSIFTTHTPLTAGTDVFPFPLFEKYFGHAYQRFGTDRDTLLQLGVFPPDPGAGFNMTAFALRMTKFTNAVSKKHGEVARQMWASIWPERSRKKFRSPPSPTAFIC